MAGESDHSLTRRTLDGLIWMYASTGGTILLHTVVTAVLARLIAPAEFGAVAAGLVVIGLARVSAEVGMETAVVQRPELTPAHIRVAFTLAVVMATVTSAVIVALSGRIAALFGIPAVAGLLPFMVLALIAESLSLGRFLLQRELQFSRLAMVTLASYVAGYACVAVPLAVRGWGASAVVAGQVGQAVVKTVLLWRVRPHNWRPSLAPGPARDLVRIGGGDMLSNYASLVARQGDTFVVGRFLGAASLGLYDRAYQLMVVPTYLFGLAIRQVLFPAMAAVQGETEKLRSAYRVGVSALAAIALPTSVVAVLVSKELILVLLGRDWLGLLSAFNVLICAMVFKAVATISNSLIFASGAVYRQASRDAAFAVLVVVGALIGRRWGLTGVAVGVFIAMTVDFLVMAQISLSLVEMSWRSFAAAHVPALLLAAGMGVAAHGAAVLLRLVAAPAAVVVSGATVTAVAAAIACFRIAPAHRSLSSLAALVRALLQVLVDSPMGKALLHVAGRRYRVMFVTAEPGAG